jgi:hypothetical protein
LDWEGLYGSDECAMKAASHELNGLACVHGVGASVGDTRLCVPLMVLIDELGFRYVFTCSYGLLFISYIRLICVSILPIDGDTIAYGSKDGGRTMHRSNETLNKLMEQVKASSFGNQCRTLTQCCQVGTRLNLRGHLGGFNPPAFMYGSPNLLFRILVVSLISLSSHGPCDIGTIFFYPPIISKNRICRGSRRAR